jgi:transcriptional regulator with GAF, ATPase, and Fis domain
MADTEDDARVRRMILGALQRSGGDVLAAAKALGQDQSTMRKSMRRLGMVGDLQAIRAATERRFRLRD